MSTNNNVFKVIPTLGDQAIASADATLGDLLVGQIGVFSYQTNLAIDGTDLPLARNFYLAMGVDTTGDGNADDIVKSSGSHIQTANITSYASQCYVAPLPMIVDISGFNASCDTEYGIKIEFENSQIGKNYGFNQFTKTFVIQTACCAECEDCPSGSCTDLAERMVAEVNNDLDNVVHAEYSAYHGILTVTNGSTAGETDNFTITYSDGTEQSINVTSAALATIADVANNIAIAFNLATGTSAISDGVDTVEIFAPKAGTVVFTPEGGGDVAVTVTQEILVEQISVGDYAAWKTLYPGICPSIRLVSEPAAIANYCNINLKYYASRETFLIVSTIEGFDCGVIVTTNQQLTYEQGSGYDIAQLEYTSGGWNGKPGPYRVGTLVGTDFGNFQNLASRTGHYNVINLGYDQYSVGGWQEYRNNLSTIIAIPCADTTTSAQLLAVLDLIVGGKAGFSPLELVMFACDACPDIQE